MQKARYLAFDAIVSRLCDIVFCDPDGTNFNKIYGRFKEIGLLEVGAVFEWHNDFGLDVSLGIDEIF